MKKLVMLSAVCCLFALTACGKLGLLDPADPNAPTAPANPNNPAPANPNNPAPANPNNPAPANPNNPAPANNPNPAANDYWFGWLYDPVINTPTAPADAPPIATPNPDPDYRSKKSWYSRIFSAPDPDDDDPATTSNPESKRNDRWFKFLYL